MNKEQKIIECDKLINKFILDHGSLLSAVAFSMENTNMLLAKKRMHHL